MTAPLTALPAARTPDPQSAPPIRWGILGTGGIASAMVDAMQKNSRQEIVAVGSRTAERAQAFAFQRGIARAHGSMDALLADDEVDAVYIASPHSEHHREALAVIAAGKHALVEKAFTRTAAEAREVIAAAQAADVLVMEAMWARFLPQADVVRQLVDTGALGEIRVVTADHGQWFERDPEHRLFNPDLAGGALLDLGIYPLSFASMVLGSPERITATGGPTFTGVDGYSTTILDFAGGGQAVVNTTLEARTPTSAVINGSLARVRIAGPFYFAGPVTYTHRDGSELTFDGAAAGVLGHHGLVYEAAHFAQLVTDDQRDSPIMPNAETVSILATIDEIRRQIGC